MRKENVQIGKPVIMIKDFSGFDKSEINMTIQIEPISAEVSDIQIQNTLNKVLKMDTNLNGLIWNSIRHKSWLELQCYISAKSNDIVPNSFFKYYCRPLTKVITFSKISVEDVISGILI